MKCQDCELLLEDYFDGETDDRRSTAIAAHLKTCAACSEIYEGLAAEQSLYAAYEREVEVTPALWAGVEARLRADAREVGGKVGFLQRLRGRLAPLLIAPRFSPALTAALVIFAITGTAVVMKNMNGQRPRPTETADAGKQGSGAPPVEAPTPNQSSPAATTSESPQPAPSSPPPSAPFSTPQPTPKQRIAPALPDPNKAEMAVKRPKQGVVLDKNTPNAPRIETAADKLVREAEQRYVAAIRILERDVKTRQQKLDPDTRARFEETLASIDRTIAETRKSARQHGNDPVAVQYMLSAYAKKVEVMREMAALGSAD